MGMMELQRQISHQVMENALASVDDTPQQQQQRIPQQQRQRTPQPHQYHQQRQPQFNSPQYSGQKTYEQKPGHPFTAMAIVSAVAVIFAMLVSGPDARTVVKVPPCFMDNPENQIQNGDIIVSCDESLPKQPCPQGATCAAGLISGCPGSHFEVSEAGNACVLSSSANSTLSKVEATLADWTVQSMCSKCEFARKSESNVPRFTISKLHEETNVSLLGDILPLSPMFELSHDDEDGERLVQLSDEYRKKKLQVSLSCYTGLFLSALIFGCWNLIVWVIANSLGTVFDLCIYYPLTVIGCAVALWVFRSRQNHKVEHEHLLQDVVRVRQMVYEQLMNDCAEHAVLHLRDGIAMDMFPTSHADRSYLIKQVWPRVVGDVRLDNRIAKCNKLCGGRPRDIWQWVANPSRRSI